MQLVLFAKIENRAVVWWHGMIIYFFRQKKRCELLKFWFWLAESGAFPVNP
jgi:hypothetical protein